MSPTFNRVARAPVAAIVIGCLLVSGCASKAALIRKNETGPTIEGKVIPIFLGSALNTATHEGPILAKLAEPIKLSSGQVIPQDAFLRGYFVTRGNRVLFAPSFVQIKGEAKEWTNIAVNSNQTGQIALTPSTAKYMKQAGKGAAVGAGVGALAGGLSGAEYGWEGALIGVAVGAIAGGAIGAGTASLGVWLNGDEPVSLPEGSGLIIHIVDEKD